ncbi:MAG: transcriptional regulator [Chloroflexi bacterium]|nr:transcriptional regulator [Chloroflexota bacterium]
MPRQEILTTKLIPPRLPRYALLRPRVDAQLRASLDHRVTLMQASTGYGKSTALAQIAEWNVPLFWYTVSEGDADPYLFLAHLIAAFRLGMPALSDAPLALLQDAGDTRVALDALLNALASAIEAPALLIVDDYHLAASPDVDSLMDHLLAFLPRDLHVIVATRYADRPQWEHLASWRARGQVLDLKRDALAFTRDEIAALFRDQYACELTDSQVAALEEKTEGWSIALQLVWQEMRAHPQTDVAALLARGAESLDTLFAYLARDVLAQQPADAQTFLLHTAVLRELDAAACAAVCPSTDARAMLAQLHARDLFIVALGDSHFRYHNLFHDFLRAQAQRDQPDAVLARHRTAAEFYRHAENHDEAMYHLLRARAFDDAARVIERIGETLLRAGRLETLSAWMEPIPPDVVAAHPTLMFHLGDLARLRSRFDEALAWYAQAEHAWRNANDSRGITRALRGRALVYLDTVRPAQAEDSLEEALRLSDGMDDRIARARLLELLAENKLNMGKAQDAEQLRAQARALYEEGPSEDALSVRVKLRTGRHDEAREILQDWARAERGQMHAPRAARETLLLLALIDSLQGRADEAFAAAQEGIALGARLHSPFVTAVGKMRLGHAYQLRGDLARAVASYEDAIALGDQLAVRRVRAEAMWGMSRARGFAGDLDAAQKSAVEGVKIARDAGDAWVIALVQIALGASLVTARRDREGIEALNDALAGFRSCGDTFGRAAARLWLALAYWHLRQPERMLAHLDDALALAQEHRYDYLLTTPTLIGWQAPRVGVPLLLHARRRGKHVAYITRLLGALGLGDALAHPGYQLRVFMLGAFRVWRGDVEISAREWQRKKARQLLQVFLTRRGQWLERETIFETLWRGESPASAARDFKVALNALNKALEPEREADDAPAFIAREGSAYQLRAGADVWLDTDEFTALIARAEQSADDDALDLYRRALALYADDLLATDARYEDWAIAERERLLALYLRAADRLAAECLARGMDDECVAWCERVLARDRCWEHAYRLMMRAYAQRGDRAQARRVFEQCVRALRDELDVEPSSATIAVMKEESTNNKRTNE